MTTIEPHRRVSIEFLAAACAAICVFLLAATTATAGTSQSSAASSTQEARVAHVQRSVAVASAAAARTLTSRTHALRKCKRRHPARCASASRAVTRAQHTIVELREQWASSRKEHLTQAGQDGSSTSAGGGSSSSTGRASGSTSNNPPSYGGSAPEGSTSDPGSNGSTSDSSSSTSPESSSTGSGELESGGGQPGTGGLPSEAPSEDATTFQPGINSGSAALWELPGAVKLGAKVVRIGLEINEPMAQIEQIVGAYAADGIRVAPLAEFNGRLPSPAEAKNLSSWAKAFGPGGTFWATHPGGQFAIQTIEFGNETSFNWQYSENTPASYASRAQTYASRFAEAANAIKTTGVDVGLLAQGDSGNAGPIWVENMFKAVPDLASLVAGWTVHPYGPQWRAKLEELVSQTAAAGAPSSIPVDITEWGLSSDNGACLSGNYGWNPCMTYQEASEVLSRTVTEMRTMLHGRLGMFLLYKIRDQKAPGESSEREDYFGALQSELEPKGAFTSEVESLLADA